MNMLTKTCVLFNAMTIRWISDEVVNPHFCTKDMSRSNGMWCSIHDNCWCSILNDRLESEYNSNWSTLWNHTWLFNRR